MIALIRHLTNVRLLGLTVLTTALILGGCSDADSPTAPNHAVPSQGDMWSPQPGEQIAEGQEVPILNPGYWESMEGNEVNPNPWFSIRLIGPNGGTVPLGNHSYQIPGGAVNAYMWFFLANASLTGIGVDCGPSPFTFNGQVTLKLSYAGTQYDVPGLNPANLHIYWVHPNGTLEMLNTSVNPGQKVLITHVNHFSRYIVG